MADNPWQPDTTHQSGVSTKWGFTLNNYTDEEEAHLQGLDVRYICYGREIAPETGTPHLQGVLALNGKQRLSWLRANVSDRAHWYRIRRGSGDNPVIYAKKDGDFFEKGVWPGRRTQGKRTDWQKALNFVKEGADLVTILEDQPHLTPNIKGLEKLQALYAKRRTWKPVVKWFWGPTGTGKTRTAYAESDADVWESTGSLKWWPGYRGQRHVILDDFRGSYCTFAYLLRLLDRYPFQIEFKGGHQHFVAEQIIITSCHHPKDVYHAKDGGLREDVGQLIRRIDEIRHFPRAAFNPAAAPDQAADVEEVGELGGAGGEPGVVDVPEWDNGEESN